MPINIAIDGPSGAGKSTIAKLVAADLHFTYIDTGAIYRAIGLFARRCGADPTDGEKVTALLPRIQIALRHEDGAQRVYLNGEDVSQEIREHEISKYASSVSAIPEVRQFLLALQRDIAARQDVIMDGRDIGTVVLPHADIKIFLTASTEDRARRRFEELRQRGQSVDFDQILRDIAERDYNDSHRAVAPLRAAEDAVVIDTTGNELEKSVAIIKKTIKDRL
ncbi:(d)CMP kinase [Feifania hominis]|uniref:Cytidylate kinase n=1 Tax=Feifania hominis TaxID=2763660 RepID=A0A926DCX7_9FIRM|nr:(d)CMP kinase [Feifania hominis]MBC8535526.1 (d)CMP kinase [Feifania hominis]